MAMITQISMLRIHSLVYLQAQLSQAFLLQVLSGPIAPVGTVLLGILIMLHREHLAATEQHLMLISTAKRQMV